jgi:hypothetical protein
MLTSTFLKSYLFEKIARFSWFDREKEDEYDFALLLFSVNLIFAVEFCPLPFIFGVR